MLVFLGVMNIDIPLSVSVYHCELDQIKYSNKKKKVLFLSKNNF